MLGNKHIVLRRDTISELQRYDSISMSPNNNDQKSKVAEVDQKTSYNNCEQRYSHMTIRETGKDYQVYRAEIEKKSVSPQRRNSEWIPRRPIN